MKKGHVCAHSHPNFACSRSLTPIAAPPIPHAIHIGAKALSVPFRWSYLSLKVVILIYIYRCQIAVQHNSFAANRTRRRSAQSSALRTQGGAVGVNPWNRSRLLGSGGVGSAQSICLENLGTAPRGSTCGGRSGCMVDWGDS